MYSNDSYIIVLASVLWYLQEKYTGIECDNTYTCPIIDTLKHYIWKAIAPEVRSRGTQNLELEV